MCVWHNIKGFPSHFYPYFFDEIIIIKEGSASEHKSEKFPSNQSGKCFSFLVCFFIVSRASVESELCKKRRKQNYQKKVEPTILSMENILVNVEIKARNENLYVFLMCHINVILKCKSRLVGAVVAIYCAITMKIMFMKLNNWFIHRNMRGQRRRSYEEIKLRQKCLRNLFYSSLKELSARWQRQRKVELKP